MMAFALIGSGGRCAGRAAAGSGPMNWCRDGYTLSQMTIGWV